MIPGVKFNLNGKDYLVPALNLQQMEDMASDLDIVLSSTGTVPDKERIDIMVRVIKSAINRNYPEITEQDIKNGCDANNLIDIVMAIFGTDKKKVVSTLEAIPSGSQG